MLIKIELILKNVKQVTLQANRDAEISITENDVEIVGDYHRLLQVFTNIFANSIKHSGPSCKIDCSINNLSESIEINIDDNGPGISENKKDLVFERFYRVDSSRNSKDGGSGIGLAIAKQIITMHNGDISISNSPSGGTRVRIELLKNQDFINHNEVSESLQLGLTTSSKHNIFDSNQKNPPKEKTIWNSIQSTT